MIHIRTDNGDDNSSRTFACGIRELPPGDSYFFEGEYYAVRANCPRCNPSGPAPIGTPISELSGRPGHRGYDKFCQIASSWGYD